MMGLVMISVFHFSKVEKWLINQRKILHKFLKSRNKIENKKRVLNNDFDINAKMIFKNLKSL